MVAAGRIKILLDPDTRKLDRALKGTKIGVGGVKGDVGEGNKSQKKQAKNSDVMVGITKKLLGTVASVVAILTALEFIIRPLAALLTAVLALFFLPLIPIVRKIIDFFTKESKEGKVSPIQALREAPQLTIARDAGVLETAIKSVINIFLRVGAFFRSIVDKLPSLNDIIRPFFEFATEGKNKLLKFLIFPFEFVGARVILLLMDIFETGFSFFKDIGLKIWDGFIKKGWEFFLDVGEKSWDIIKGAFSFINDAIRSAANAIIGLVNRIPFVNVPRLAAGGIVTRPTLAVVGEKGPEAVIPLNQAKGFGGNVTINFNNPIVRQDSDLRKIADQVSRIMAQGKLRGFSPNL